MATLPTITFGNYSATNSTADGVVGTQPVLDNIATPVDASYVHSTNSSTGAYVAWFPLADMPADFGSMTTLSIRVRYHRNVNDALKTWDSLTATVFTADGGTTALTATRTLATNITTTTATNTAVLAFSGVVASNKTTWDGAWLRITWNVTKTKGGASDSLRVTAAELTGTYAAALPTGTASPTLANATSTASGTFVAPPASYPFTWPSTNPAIEWGGSFVGPIQDSNGNLYVAVEESAALPDIQMWKSTDGGLTFTLAAGELNILRDCEAAWIEPIPGRTDELLVCMQRSGSDVRTKRFGMSGHATNADAFFGTRTDAEVGATTNDQSVSVAAWGGGSDLLGVHTIINATTFDKIRYNTWSAATDLWGTAADLMVKASTNYAGPFVVAGASGGVYVFYTNKTDGRIEMKTITSGGTLSPASTVDGTQINTNGVTVTTKAGVTSAIIGSPIYYDDAGTEVIQVIWMDNADKLWMNEIRGGTVGTTPIQVSTRSVQSNYVTDATNESPAATMVVHNKKVHVFFGDLTNGDMYHAESDNFGAFPTEDLVFSGLSINSQMSSAVIDIGGSDHVGLVWVNGDAVLTEDNDILFNVYELTSTFSGSSAVTLEDATSTASGTHVGPPISGSSAVTLADATSTATGTHVAPAFSGTSAVTLGDATSTASGTHVAPTFSGSSAAALADATSAATGTHVAPAVTGTLAVTLADATSTAVGTHVDPTLTGTASVTLEDATPAASGTFTNPTLTGTSAVTLNDATSAAAGTYTPAPVSGSSAVTLDDATSAATGTHVAPTFSGSSAVTLEDAAGVASGTFTNPTLTGTASATLDDATSSASGTFVGAGVAGNASATLADATSTASGAFTNPTVTGSSSTTLADATSTATGAFITPTFSGTSAVTLEDATPSAAGTFTPSTISGTSSTTLDDATSGAAGTHAPPSFTGSLSTTLGDTTATGAGSFTVPTFTGTTSTTLNDATSAAAGTYTPAPVTGTLAVTLADATSTAIGNIGGLDADTYIAALYLERSIATTYSEPAHADTYRERAFATTYKSGA